MLTAKELSKRAGVGTTTVMRLVKTLGYNGYFDFKKEFYENQIDRHDKWLNVQKSFYTDEKDSFSVIADVAQENIRLIEESVNIQLVENFDRAMDQIEKASRINIIGYRTYRGVSIYLESLLIEFHANVQQLSHDSESVFDRLLQCEQDEVVIIFAFSNYLQRTIDAASVASEKNLNIILITDQLSCPIAEFADIILKVNTGGEYFTISPIIMLIEAIIVELGKRTSNYSIENIQKLFNKLKEKDIILKK